MNLMNTDESTDLSRFPEMNCHLEKSRNMPDSSLAVKAQQKRTSFVQNQAIYTTSKVCKIILIKMIYRNYVSLVKTFD